MEGQEFVKRHTAPCVRTLTLWSIFSTAAHIAKFKKVYISRYDKAMRLIIREIQNGSLGNFYCTADVGTAVAIEDLGATSKRSPNG
jgi:hypothetical protein